MAFVAPNIQRIKPFLLLLASDQPGEVVAAANALVRALQATGHDLHDLFQLLNSTLTPTTATKESSKESEHRDIAKAILAHDKQHNSLSDKEREFVRNMKRYRLEPTERQRDWLADIYSKLFGEAK